MQIKKMGKISLATLLSVILFLTAVIPIGATTDSTAETETADDYRPYGYTDPEKPIEGRTYFIRSKNSGKYITLTEDTEEEVTIITQQAYTGNADQKWTLSDPEGDGTYHLLSLASGNTLAISVTPAINVNNTVADVQPLSTTAGSILFKIAPTSDGTSYKILTKCSAYSKVLAVLGASQQNGAKIIQYDYDNSAICNDEWFFESPIDDYSVFDPQHTPTPIDGDTYYLKNLNSGLYLSLGENNTNVQQSRFGGTENQKWKFSLQSDGTYKLSNAALSSQNTLAVENASTSNNANILVQADTDSDAMKFKLVRNADGQSYRILTKLSNYQKCMTVYGAGGMHGANIIQYTYNAGQNDCWVLEKDRPVMQIEDNKTYYIKNRRSGLYLDTANGATTAGTQVIQQTLDPEAVTQRWKIVNTANGIKIQSDASSGQDLVLSVEGAQNSNDAAILLNEYNTQNDGMHFKIIKNSDGYSYRLLTKNSSFEKCVTVQSASYFSGASIIQYNYNDGWNDAWILEPAIETNVYYDNHYVAENSLTDGVYYIKSKSSGLYLDVYWGYDEDGTNIIQWTGNGGKGQQWKFVPAGDGTYKIMTMLGNSTRGLSVNPAGNSNNADIELKTYDNSSGMRFKVLRNSDSLSYRIVSECSNFTKGLNVYYDGKEPGDEIIQYTYIGTGNDEWYLDPIVQSTDLTVLEENPEIHIVNHLKSYWEELSEAVYEKTSVHLVKSYTKVFSPVDQCASGNSSACGHETHHKDWGTLLGWISSYNQELHPGSFAALHTGTVYENGSRGGLAYTGTGGNAFIMNIQQCQGLYSNVGVIAHEFTHNFGVFHHITEDPNGEAYNGVWSCCQGGLPGVDVVRTQKPDYWCDHCLRKIIFFASRHAG